MNACYSRTVQNILERATFAYINRGAEPAASLNSASCSSSFKRLKNVSVAVLRPVLQAFPPPEPAVRAGVGAGGPLGAGAARGALPQRARVLQALVVGCCCWRCRFDGQF